MIGSSKFNTRSLSFGSLQRASAKFSLYWTKSFIEKGRCIFSRLKSSSHSRANLCQSSDAAMRPAIPANFLFGSKPLAGPNSSQNERNLITMGVSSVSVIGEGAQRWGKRPPTRLTYLRGKARDDRRAAETSKSRMRAMLEGKAHQLKVFTT